MIMSDTHATSPSLAFSALLWCSGNHVGLSIRRPGFKSQREYARQWCRDTSLESILGSNPSRRPYGRRYRGSLAIPGMVVHPANPSTRLIRAFGSIGRGHTSAVPNRVFGGSNPSAPTWGSDRSPWRGGSATYWTAVDPKRFGWQGRYPASVGRETPTRSLGKSVGYFASRASDLGSNPSRRRISRPQGPVLADSLTRQRY